MAAAVLLAGCGGSPRDERTAIGRALAASDDTYLFYRAPIWWGRDAHVHVELIRVDGRYAVARIRAGRGAQWAFLEKRGVWRVREVVNRKGVYLYCKLGPAEVMRDLIGGCQLNGLISYGSLVRGPTDRRPATAAEARAIGASYIRRILAGDRPCGHLVVQISRVDRSYASVAHEPPMRTRDCAVDGNGVALYHRTSEGWKLGPSASDGFGCGQGPPGVIRSLFGACWTG